VNGVEATNGVKIMKKDIEQEKWWVVDAGGQRLGRISTKIANLLRAKGKASFSPNRYCGDYVIVKNVEKVKLTGSKLENKIYYSHSGFIGNLKKVTAGELLKKNPGKLVYESVRGMLPKNKLRDRFMKKLKIYAGDSHPHEAQKPEPVKIEK